MTTYRELYFYLFRATEQARQALEQQNIGIAVNILIEAQKAAEDAVLSDDFQTDANTIPTVRLFSRPVGYLFPFQ